MGYQVSNHFGVDNGLEDFAEDGKETDRTVIRRVGGVARVLKDRNNGRGLPAVRKTGVLEAAVVQFREGRCQFRCAFLQDNGWYSVAAGSLVGI